MGADRHRRQRHRRRADALAVEEDGRPGRTRFHQQRRLLACGAALAPPAAARRVAAGGVRVRLNVSVAVGSPAVIETRRSSDA